MPSGPSLHLFVVCTEPCPRSRVAIANVTSWVQDGSDSTVQFHGGEHPSIDHHSYVAYRHAKIESTVNLEAGLRNGHLIARPDLAEAHVSRIEAGLLKSKFTPRRVKRYLSGDV